MIVPSKPLAASTCRSSASAPTATSASTSPVPRWPPALASRPWPNRPRINNARFFDNDINQVPTHCITQGIGTIMKARHLVLLAFGAGKAEAIEETVEGGLSAFCRLPRCRCTRTPRLSWMRRPPLVCATRTTIATPTPTSRPGRASELSCAGFPLCVRGAVECNETEGGYRRRHMCIASRLDHPQSRFASQLPLAGAHER